MAGGGGLGRRSGTAAVSELRTHRSPLLLCFTHTHTHSLTLESARLTALSSFW